MSSSTEDDSDKPLEEEITLFPLIGFATHTLPDQGVMLTLELPVDSEAPDGARYRLYVGLRANGTRQLAASLLRGSGDGPGSNQNEKLARVNSILTFIRRLMNVARRHARNDAGRALACCNRIPCVELNRVRLENISNKDPHRCLFRRAPRGHNPARGAKRHCLS